MFGFQRGFTIFPLYGKRSVGRLFIQAPGRKTDRAMITKAAGLAF
jgi:hypothetical protein